MLQTRREEQSHVNPSARDRRTAFRYNVDTPCKLRFFVGNQVRIILARLIDLSQTGVQVLTREALAIDHLVLFELTVGTQVDTLYTQVQWSRPGVDGVWAIGLRILDGSVSYRSFTELAHGNPDLARTPRCLQVLGLEVPCTVDDVRHAYRRLAMEAHPDRGGSPERFALIHDAYVEAMALVSGAAV